jgi:competence protein ComEC
MRSPRGICLLLALMVAVGILEPVETAQSTSPPSGPAVRVATHPGTFDVHFVDTGTGDATIIDAGEYEVIIDGGYSVSALQDYVTKWRLIEGPIDLVVLTHSDTDHWRGFKKLLGFDGGGPALQVRRFWEPGHDRGCRPLQSYSDFISRMRTLPSEKDGSGLLPAATSTGQVQSFTAIPGLVLKVLHWSATPEGMGGDCAYNINNASIVLRAEMAGSSFLFTGDANGKRRAELAPGTPRYVEAALLDLDRKLPGTLKADVLKVPHHGSETASTQAFINAVNPCYAVISASAHHHLPVQSVLDRYRATSRTVLSTYEPSVGRANVVCRATPGAPVNCTSDASAIDAMLTGDAREAPANSDNDCGNEDDDERGGNQLTPPPEPAPTVQTPTVTPERWRSLVAVVTAVLIVAAMLGVWWLLREQDLHTSELLERLSIYAVATTAARPVKRDELLALLNRGARENKLLAPPSIDEVLENAVAMILDPQKTVTSAPKKVPDDSGASSTPPTTAAPDSPTVSSPGMLDTNTSHRTSSTSPITGGAADPSNPASASSQTLSIDELPSPTLRLRAAMETEPGVRWPMAHVFALLALLLGIASAVVLYSSSVATFGDYPIGASATFAERIRSTSDEILSFLGISGLSSLGAWFAATRNKRAEKRRSVQTSPPDRPKPKRRRTPNTDNPPAAKGTRLEL